MTPSRSGRAHSRPSRLSPERQDKQFRLLVEEIEEYAIFMLDPEGRVTTWNAGAERLKGYARDEILGTHFSAFYQADEVAAGTPDRALKIAARDGQWIDEGWRKRKDGGCFWARVTITALHDEGGNLQGFAKITHDMTERRQWEDELRESEAMFKTLAEKALVGIGMLQGGAYTYVNPAFADIFGYTREEIIGQSPEMLFHPDDWPAVRDQVRRRLEGELQEAHYEARGVTKGGAVRYVEVRGSSIRYQGQPTVLGTIVDVTDHRRRQEKLLQVQDAERHHLGRELHDGVASLLTLAAMYTSGLAGELRAGKDLAVEDLDAATEFIQKAANEARALSHGLSPVELEQGLEAALEQLTAQVEQSNELSCEFKTTGSLPDLSEATATHLYRIAQEAVSNAVEHAKAHRIWVSLTAGDAGKTGKETESEIEIVLTIRDDGRGHAGPRAREGGIGMHTMRRRANLIGGALTVETVSGEGTTVRCRLGRSQ